MKFKDVVNEKKIAYKNDDEMSIKIRKEYYDWKKSGVSAMKTEIERTYRNLFNTKEMNKDEMASQIVRDHYGNAKVDKAFEEK
jgi:thiamine biosynthesis protein ThiC